MKTNETGTEECGFLADKARDAGARRRDVNPFSGITESGTGCNPVYQLK
jgi:hypothetical protein